MKKNKEKFYKNKEEAIFLQAMFKLFVSKLFTLVMIAFVLTQFN